MLRLTCGGERAVLPAGGNAPTLDVAVSVKTRVVRE